MSEYAVNIAAAKDHGSMLLFMSLLIFINSSIFTYIP